MITTLLIFLLFPSAHYIFSFQKLPWPAYGNLCLVPCHHRVGSPEFHVPWSGWCTAMEVLPKFKHTPHQCYFWGVLDNFFSVHYRLQFFYSLYLKISAVHFSFAQRHIPDTMITLQSNFSLLQLQLNLILDFALDSNKCVDQTARVLNHLAKQSASTRITRDTLRIKPKDLNLTGYEFTSWVQSHWAL